MLYIAGCLLNCYYVFTLTCNTQCCFSQKIYSRTPSWARLEGSGEAGGLPGLYLLKTIIPIFCVLMLLQGAALLARSILILKGDTRYLQQSNLSEAP